MKKAHITFNFIMYRQKQIKKSKFRMFIIHVKSFIPEYHKKLHMVLILFRFFFILELKFYKFLFQVGPFFLLKIIRIFSLNFNHRFGY